jgi:threonine dehydratase
METTPRSIALDDIYEARRHVYEAAIRTPLLRLNWEDARGEIYLKLENLQPIGAFKIRGAWNAVRLLPPEERKNGVWTVSAGNAAQGVAWAARHAGVPCRVLVMDSAPAAKLRAIERLGATYVKAPFDECWSALLERRHPRMAGAFVHPFEDDSFIAGNASIGLEILEDLPEVTAVVAAFGGGGLACGIAAALDALKPGVKVFAAEPATAAPLHYSLQQGAPEYFPNWQPSWVDGCGGKSVFPRMWALAQHLLAGSIVVSLDQIATAMRIVAERNRVIAEGAGGCAVAAGLTGEAGDGNIVCIVSGGNIDLSRFCELVSHQRD